MLEVSRDEQLQLAMRILSNGATTVDKVFPHPAYFSDVKVRGNCLPVGKNYTEGREALRLQKINEIREDRIFELHRVYEDWISMDIRDPESRGPAAAVDRIRIFLRVVRARLCERRFQDFSGDNR